LKQNSVVRLKSNILASPKIFGLATPLFFKGMELPTSANLYMKVLSVPLIQLLGQRNLPMVIR